jgi:phosphoribosylaminoimidazole carboxylase (EC 4.1.1.21)
MYNLIGTLPDIKRVLRIPGAHLHLYGKSARPARKLGHVTLTASSTEELAAREALLREVVVAAASEPATTTTP